MTVDINEDKEFARSSNLYNDACILPRLAVGLTKQGSLVGVFSCVIYS
jgi:hypothetical protein